jgi:hypothetical protein
MKFLGAAGEPWKIEITIPLCNAAKAPRGDAALTN